MKKIFLNANIFELLLRDVENFTLFASCDLLTSEYYFTRKPLGQKMALEKIKKLNHIIKVIEFGNTEVAEAIELMERNKKSFVSGDVPVLSSTVALKIFEQKK